MRLTFHRPHFGKGFIKKKVLPSWCPFNINLLFMFLFTSAPEQNDWIYWHILAKNMVEAVKRLTALNKCPLPLNQKPNVGERKSIKTNEWRPQRPSERRPEKAKMPWVRLRMNYSGSQKLPRGNNCQMNWVLTLFFFSNIDHFISPSNNHVRLVLVFSSFTSFTNTQKT